MTIATVEVEKSSIERMKAGFSWEMVGLSSAMFEPAIVDADDLGENDFGVAEPGIDEAEPVETEIELSDEIDLAYDGDDSDPSDFMDLEDYLEAYDKAQTGEGYEALNKVHQQRRSALRDVPTNDFLSRYMLETNRQRLLTADEEVSLARQIELGQYAQERLAETGIDPEEKQSLQVIIDQAEAARAMLVRSNTRLVISIAKRYFGQGLDFLDLIQEGNIGLLTAVDKFDYRRGTRFSTYATWWIRQGITRALSNYGRMIRIPAHQTGNVRKIYRAIRDIEKGEGRQADVEELAVRTELPPSQVQWLLQITRPLLALEQPAGDDQDAELADFIEDRDVDQPVDLVASKLFGERIGEVLAELTPREAAIIRLRYGLQGVDSHTLKEVGEIFNLSRERIRQVEKSALSKLRRSRRMSEFAYMMN
jgi:RNA polymerase sigma factor (sigma-70 family)